jgi:hypothetical protein
MKRAGAYYCLLGITLLSFVALYILMYAMVDRFANVLNNRNQVYMAGLMAAPMVLPGRGRDQRSAGFPDDCRSALLR